jgi:hypothetical protein
VDAGSGPALASYRAAAPGGRFDAADNGQYSIRFMSAQGPTVGQFVVAAPAPRAHQAAVRQFSGVLRADLGQPGTWGLERPSGGVLALDVAAVSADSLALSGQRVVLGGRLSSVLNVSAQRGRKSRVFVVTSIRAAAP